MRAALLFFATLSLAGCFRIAQGGPDDVGASASGIDCVYGKIATVPGLPLGIASTGKTIFVVSSDVPGVIGDLRAVGNDGSVRLVVDSDAYIGMAVSGPTLAFNRRKFDRENNFLSATVELVDSDFTMTTIDATSNDVSMVDSLTSDSTGALYWYRWAPPLYSYDPTNYGLPAIAKYDHGTTTYVALDASITIFPHGLTTDGTGYFSVFGTQQNSGIVGRLPVAGSSALVLATSKYSNSFLSVVGVDDTNVVYLTYGSSAASLNGWTVPKNGGAPTQFVSEQTLSSSPFLHDHHLYWAQQNADGTASVARVSTQSTTIETVASEAAPVQTLAADSCGVVYATTDSSEPGLTKTSVYRAKF